MTRKRLKPPGSFWRKRRVLAVESGLPAFMSWSFNHALALFSSQLSLSKMTLATSEPPPPLGKPMTNCTPATLPTSLLPPVVIDISFVRHLHFSHLQPGPCFSTSVSRLNNATTARGVFLPLRSTV